MDSNTAGEYFPPRQWLESRQNPDAKPLYKIISRSMTRYGDSVVMLHKAGDNFFENYFIHYVVTDNFIMDNLSKKEADLLRWGVNSELTDPLKS